MQLFRLFGEVALRGGQAVVTGLKQVEKAAERAEEAIEDVKDEANNLPREKTVQIDVDTSGFMGGVLALGPALVPMMATVGAAVGGIGAAFAAAGAGAAAFGAIAIPALGGIFEASKEVEKIEEKIAKADTWKEKQEALKEMDALYASMNSKQREALKALQGFKSFGSDFVGGLQNPVLNMFIAGLNTLKTVLNGLKPVFKNAIAAVSDLFDGMNEAVKGQQMKAFFDWLAVNVGPAITNFGTAFGNVMSGIMSLMMAFGPVSTDMQNGLVGLTQRFAEWAAGLSKSQGFKDFISYVQTNGPKVMALLSELATTMIELIKAMAPMGPIVLDAVTGFLQMVNHLLQLHPAVGVALVSIIQLIGAIKLIGAGANAFLNLKNAIAQVGVVFKTLGNWLKPLMNGLRILGPAVLRLAGILRVGLVGAFRAVIMVLNLLRVAFLTNPFTLIITAVVVAVALIIMHWDKVKAFLLTTWEAIKTAAITVWNAIKNFFASVWEGIKSIVQSAVTWYVNRVKQNWELVKTVTTTVWNAIKNFFSSVWNGIKSIVSSAVTWYVNRVKQNWQTIKSVTTSVWNGIKSFFSSVWNGIKSFVSSAVNGIKSTITSIWNSIKSVTSSVWNSIKSTISKGINSVWSTVKGYAGRFLSAGKALLDSLARGISQGISKAISAVKSGMEKIRSFLPFSPAKEGPLKDLDKSGESFFPTWASGVERGRRPMLRAIAANMARARRMMEGGGPPYRRSPGGVMGAAPMAAPGNVIITGNTFHIREEADIERTAWRLYQLQRERQRGPGGRRT